MCRTGSTAGVFVMVELKVGGMQCGHCVATVGKAVRAVPGVQDVRIDLGQGQVTVTGNPDIAAVRAAIAREGYTVQAG